MTGLVGTDLHPRHGLPVQKKGITGSSGRSSSSRSTRATGRRAVRTPRLFNTNARPRAAQRLDDRQDVGGKGRRLCDLNLSSERRCLRCVASIPQLGTLGLLHDRVVVRRIELEDRTAGGIIIPDTAKEKPQEGEIIGVGPGASDESGKLITSRSATASCSASGRAPRSKSTAKTSSSSRNPT